MSEGEEVWLRHRCGWLVWIVVGGCIEFRLDPIDPEGEPLQFVQVEETFAQVPLPRVDLLFVVDDTASMAQEQAALADHFEAMASDLDEAGVAWQVGAVTTSMDGDQPGVLRGSPWILTPGMSDREVAFAEMVQVGTDSTAIEAGLAAAAEALALSEPGGVNAGFRRPDAVLHVVFLSDADDQSEDWLGSDPVEAFLDVLAAEQKATGHPGRASAVIGDVPGGCTSATGTAQPGQRYEDVAAASDGASVSICAPDFAPVLEDIGQASLSYQTRFVLREVPDAGTVVVRVEGAVQAAGWSVEPPSTLVFGVPPGPGSIIEVSYLVSTESR